MPAGENKNPETRWRLGRFASIVMSMTVLSRVFGFARDVILAQIFGATAAFDAFVIAFKIPNFMRRLFGEGAFSQAFIPVLVESRAARGTQGVQEFINNLTGTFGLILLVVVLLGEIAAPLLVLIFAPGFAHDPGRYQLATHLIRITFPYVFSIALVALAGAILNTYNRFALTAFTPVLLNIVLITVALAWVPHIHQPEHAIILLAWGVAFSGFLQLIIQWPALQNLRLLPKPGFQWRHSRTGRVLKQMLPALLGVSVAQISLLIDNLFASFLPVGSISWLYYSDRLIYFPLGIIAVTLATVVMPHLSYQHQQGSPQRFAATLDWALRWVFVTAIPATLGLVLLAGPILATLMHHGAFNAYDVAMTRRSLMAFALGLPALMAIKIFAPGFYAQHNTRLPARITGAAILLNIIFNFVLMGPLGHAGLALSTALASWFNAVLLWVFLRQRRILITRPGWLRLWMGILLGSLFIIAVLYWGTGHLSQWLQWNIAESVWRLLLLIGLSIGVYFFGLGLVGLRWHHFKSWG